MIRDFKSNERLTAKQMNRFRREMVKGMRGVDGALVRHSGRNIGIHAARKRGGGPERTWVTAT